MCNEPLQPTALTKHTHTATPHTFTYDYIYIYIYFTVCVDHYHFIKTVWYHCDKRIDTCMHQR